jgi:FlaG/FlaF family flagellin (archaellin)
MTGLAYGWPPTLVVALMLVGAVAVGLAALVVALLADRATPVRKHRRRPRRDSCSS